jgi:putative redox protein
MAASETRPIVVSHLGRDRLQIRVGEFELVSDQPVEDGGEDTGPTPTELFVAGLAACVGFYAERFLGRHGAVEGLKVACSYQWAEKPHRVGEIVLDVTAPRLPPGLREAFNRAIEHCTVHATLQVPPTVRMNVNAGSAAPVR